MKPDRRLMLIMGGAVTGWLTALGLTVYLASSWKIVVGSTLLAGLLGYLFGIGLGARAQPRSAIILLLVAVMLPGLLLSTLRLPWVPRLALALTSGYSCILGLAWAWCFGWISFHRR